MCPPVTDEEMQQKRGRRWLLHANILGLEEPLMLEVCSWTFASFCRGNVLNTDQQNLGLVVVVLKIAVSILMVQWPHETPEKAIKRVWFQIPVFVFLFLSVFLVALKERNEDRVNSSPGDLPNAPHWYHRGLVGRLFFYNLPNELGQPVFYQKSVKHMVSFAALVIILGLGADDWNHKFKSTLYPDQKSKVEVRSYKIIIFTNLLILETEICNRIGTYPIPHVLIRRVNELPIARRLISDPARPDQ